MTRVVIVALSKIKVDKREAKARRPHSDLRDDAHLVASIKEYGLKTPLAVTGPDWRGRYKLVAGYRRHAALLKLGEKECAVQIVTPTDQPEPEFEKVLVCTTAHVAECLATDDDVMREISSYVGDYGWYIWVGGDGSGPFTLNVSPKQKRALKQLSAILLFAKERGCKYVRFDRDAEPIPGDLFPLHNW